MSDHLEEDVDTLPLGHPTSQLQHLPRPLGRGRWHSVRIPGLNAANGLFGVDSFLVEAFWSFVGILAGLALTAWVVQWLQDYLDR